MLKKQIATSIKAPQGQKMIEVKIRFWTEDIAPEKGEVMPKHAWTSGVVQIKPNKAHGIESGSSKKFRSLLDVGATIEKALIEHGIVLHPSPKMKKYIAEK